MTIIMRYENLKIQRSDSHMSPLAILFLEEIFYEEQGIPKELIPLDRYNYHWWYIQEDDDILAIAAAWEVSSEWHWGRLAIGKEVRGKGLGTKILKNSLDDLFHMGIDKVIIDARDIAVKMIINVGGKVVGKSSDFYGMPITPMVLFKEDFIFLQ